MSCWVKEYFTREYLQKYRPRQTDDINKAECDFISRCLLLDVGVSVLDVACGYGRHVNELLARGVDAYGIDNCELYIKEAKTPRCTVQDMRRFEVQPVRAAYSFFTSFGYYSDKDNEKVIQNISKTLIPGGRFLLHTRNREWIMRHIVENQWDSYGEHTELTKRRFDLMTSRMETEIQYIQSEKKVYQSIRFYTLAELATMFKWHDLSIINSYGGIDFSPYTIDSEWMAVVAEKIS